MPAYVTYTDRDNMTIFDSLWGLERSTTEDSKDEASSTINLTINKNYSCYQCCTFTNKINSKFNSNVKLQIPYSFKESS
jgi:hypothetical protein